MTHSRLTLTLTALALSLATAAPAAAVHEVVLQDGTRVATKTRPIIALGRVTYFDASGRSVSRPASEVDLAATRAGLKDGLRAAPTVWTSADLAAARATVQLQTARTGLVEKAKMREQLGNTQSRRSSTPAQIAASRAALERVRVQRASAAGGSLEAEILDERALSLQTEILRLQTQLEIEAAALPPADEE